jgi:calcineurin-like phosphoesterase family protein
MNLNTTWVTSDTHFGHTNVIKYSNRPYANADEMDEALIKNWNSVVKPEHTIFHLGDFSFKDPEQYLRRLQGKIIYIPGNHDQMFYKNKKLLDYFENAAMLHEVTKRIDGVKFNLQAEIKYDDGARGGLIVLNHYANLVWNKSHHGALMLHGHSHGSLRYPKVMRAMDVGVDPMGYFPIRLDDAVARLSKITPPTFDHHGED